MLRSGSSGLAMWNKVTAASVEILSLLVAEIAGVRALLHAHSSSEFVLVYTLRDRTWWLGKPLISDVARAGERLAKAGAPAV